MTSWINGEQPVPAQAKPARVQVFLFQCSSRTRRFPGSDRREDWRLTEVKQRASERESCARKCSRIVRGRPIAGRSRMSQVMDTSMTRQFDKLPPHSIQAEMCLLASMMLDKEMVGQVVQIVDREVFYQADHQIIFDVLLKLYEQNRPIDAVIVREELAKRQLLDEVGGVPYL